ncbi:MAG: transposase [Saprospiraceae bacterium]|nr:transposase [Saprospiraceae bacterium]
MYSLILRVAWLTVKSIMAKYCATPGMTSILHTFGSDMKYHIHVHALVTFGGLCKASCGDVHTNQWRFRNSVIKSSGIARSVAPIKIFLFKSSYYFIILIK